MSITLDDLDNLSALARITIRPEEKEKMLADMQAILGYVSEINEVEGTLKRGSEDVFNVVREDIITHTAGSNTDAILANAPKVKDGYVEVEQVLK
jgi:aspartyl-tRNA(Asn)/glutamyl-tRNA(Gln) amidotransferase subunit C